MTLPAPRRFISGDLTMLVRRWERVAGGGTDTFVLVHGIGVSSRYFERLAGELRAHGTVFAVDLPGFGSAPRPPRQLTIEEGAALLADFLRSEQLDGAVLVGHSMGTQFVVELAAVHPNRLAGLVLAGPVVDERAPMPWQQGMRLSRDMLRESPTANWIVATDYLRSGIRWYLTELPVMLGYRTEERLPLVSVPVLVLRGSRDPIAPRGWAARLARTARDGRMIEVDGAAHVVQHVEPERTASILAAFAREAKQTTAPVNVTRESLPPAQRNRQP
ncbi:alpha/beta hydrolase [Mycetocola manganoxydans]|uniref:Alpha/beta hydrolase n=1 Tax=Mycetocola manganoxydans TaxID=699879 RepID=A0A3L6ZX04_9MICO|nr:alpha/beta hydrolase [Mycetocola manganoxydans]RLP72563.1 alpha/beta hydrolase [Mycetocola manganoxydans]